MQKEVIYIEPENDITDILSKVKNTKSKIVALVPPKKPTVLKSAVNFKLLGKAAKDSGRNIVLITADSGLLRLAAGANIPVAKNLQTRPTIPDGASTTAIKVSDGTVDGEETDRIAKSARGGDKESISTSKAVDPIDLSDDGKPADDEAEDKKGKKKKGKSPIPNFDRYRKWIIMVAVGLILLIGFLVWAFIFAPAAKITVTIRTTASNFSETVYFVKDENKDDPSGGVFLMEGQRTTKKSSVDFVATGEMDKGDKATGTLTLTRTLISESVISIPKNTSFTNNGKTFVSTEAATLAVPNYDTDCARWTGGANRTCQELRPNIATDVKIVAEAAGEDFNLGDRPSGWASIVKGFGIAGGTIFGGTSKIVKVVSQRDIDDAKSMLTSTSESEGREELMKKFEGDLIPIGSSFKSTQSDPVSSPKLGEEVTDTTTPTLTTETTFTMAGVDRVRIEEFIKSKVAPTLASDQKIYSVGIEQNKVFIEQFRESGDNRYSAKLKTTVQIGPEVTEEMIRERSMGKKVGEVQSLLKSINGVSKVQVDTSVFWLSSVPTDHNKVTVEITIEE